MFKNVWFLFSSNLLLEPWGFGDDSRRSPKFNPLISLGKETNDQRGEVFAQSHTESYKQNQDLNQDLQNPTLIFSEGQKLSERGAPQTQEREP